MSKIEHLKAERRLDTRFTRSEDRGRYPKKRAEYVDKLRVSDVYSIRIYYRFLNREAYHHDCCSCVRSQRIGNETIG